MTTNERILSGLGLKPIYNSSGTGLPIKHTISPMPPLKPLNKPKIQRIYEDDDFIIDLFPEDKTVRVSIFKDNHFQDEVFVRKTDYED